VTGRRIDLQDRDGGVRLDSLRQMARQQQKLGNQQPAAGTEFLDLAGQSIVTPPSGGQGVFLTPVYCRVHIPPQTIPSGTRTYLTNFDPQGSFFPGTNPTVMVGTSSGSQTGMYGDAPNGTNFLLTAYGIPFFPTLPAGVVNTPMGGAWVQWDGTATGAVKLELVYGPFPFPGAPVFAPGVSQGSIGNDRQSVTAPGPSVETMGFFVAVTQNSGGNRTIEGYAWISNFGLSPSS
jgi:hypothetical protein